MKILKDPDVWVEGDRGSDEDVVGEEGIDESAVLGPVIFEEHSLEGSPCLDEGPENVDLTAFRIHLKYVRLRHLKRIDDCHMLAGPVRRPVSWENGRLARIILSVPERGQSGLPDSALIAKEIRNEICILAENFESLRMRLVGMDGRAGPAMTRPDRKSAAIRSAVEDRRPLNGKVDVVLSGKDLLQEGPNRRITFKASEIETYFHV